MQEAWLKMLIIFDLDDTLIDTWNTSILPKLKIAFQEMMKAGLKIENEEKSLKRLIDINNYADNGKTTIETFLKELGCNNSLIFDVGYEAYYGGPLLDIIRPPLPHALEVLHTLHQNHTLILITHGEEKTQYDKIQKAKINPHLFLKTIVTLNYDKSESYQQILHEFDFKPQDILVIGDKHKTDLLPAKALGMKTVHMKWGKGKILVPKQDEVNYIISDLQELLKIVEELTI